MAVSAKSVTAAVPVFKVGDRCSTSLQSLRCGLCRLLPLTISNPSLSTNLESSVHTDARLVKQSASASRCKSGMDRSMAASVSRNNRVKGPSGQAAW